MRVISGEFRGLKLSSPDGVDTRPTLDRVKEAVFSMIMPYLCDAVVLDLFAGSGAMGLESLSRGAKSVVFIDNNRNAVDCIKNNVTAAKIDSRATICHTDAMSYLSNSETSFDLIFLDPPYNKGLYDSVVRKIFSQNLLAENGLIIVEWDYENGFPIDFDGFVVTKEKKYGRVGIAVLKRG